MSLIDHYYILDIKVGRIDEHYYSLLVDSGSVITFIGSNSQQPYIGSATSSKTGENFDQAFLTGERVSGFLVKDQTEISPGLILHQTDFGVVTRAGSQPLTELSTGIFALGRQNGLAYKTGSPTLNTWLRAAKLQDVIPRNLVTIDLAEPALTFGHVNLENAIGEFVYLPCVKQRSWTVFAAIPQIAFDGPILIDTGSPFLTLSEIDMNALMMRIDGSEIEPINRLLLIPVGKLPEPLTIILGDREFTLSGEQQLWSDEVSRDQYGLRYTIFQQSSAVVDVAIFGAKVLQYFIVVLDDDRARIGFSARQ
ncbi:uncharacterized protein L969DRAFT_19137 [Mixia osmundae IAM 14324]|uniref:Peptidase A1 domain-containing protein n=1 Tax=Mixia osmundae (strain CBS 9802 / IAM 14324 / JCM 22182 / KY 12970) TaxID=764103 RepID=G7E4T3_MIXOS|nr:uncharacterized protein L969DRAFT_19137 [Mixia osmundae IAM 14324]KEI37663.1 hypothetical protein L969DRAFT_19137 [Mixia osmundae IAM 14324]GAA97843.1 hypothetical protein E5Q_04522 [Mixia osmundae IAM 14324]